MREFPMHLVQILLPRADNAGRPFDAAILTGIKRDLTDRFGGLTAYSRSPAEGIWARNGEKCHDEIIIVEIMTEKLDCRWWAQFRTRLEECLAQERIVIRSHPVALI